MKVVVLLSGGLDSAVLAAWLKANGHIVLPLSILYGQRHAREVRAAQDVAEALGLPRPDVVDLGPSFMAAGVFSGSSQTDPSVPVPHGRYDEPSMKKTVVPNRNMVLISIATAYALSKGATAVAYGAHAGDHAIYPDCRPEFVEAMRKAVGLCDWQEVSLEAPFAISRETKADIVRIGHELGVPFDLTWTCYEGGALACGKCGSCRERLEAFAEANLSDPIRYATTHPEV